MRWLCQYPCLPSILVHSRGGSLNRKRLVFDLLFSAAGGLLVLFVVLPLVSTLLSTTPVDFLASFGDPEVLKSIGLTFGAAAIATVLALGSGVPLAYLLARRKFHGKRLLEAIINLPIVIPHTAAGIALLLVFGRRGLLGQWLYPLGITFTDNLAGIVVAMLFVSLPFLVNLSREAFAMVDDELERVAMTDGASHWQVFWHVTLPLAWRGVLGGSSYDVGTGDQRIWSSCHPCLPPKNCPGAGIRTFPGLWPGCRTTDCAHP